MNALKMKHVLTVGGLLIVVCGASFLASAKQGLHLDADKIATAAGTKTTTAKDGVVRIAWARTDVAVTVDGMPLQPFAGLGSWAAFTSAPHGAMVMGDTVVFEDEVTPAMDAAFAGGLEVTALHNHFFYDEPKVYFMHIGGMGEQADLAAAVKGVWDAIKKVRADHATPAKRFPGETPRQGTINSEAIEKILGQRGEIQKGVVKVTIGREGAMHDVKVGGSMGLTTWAAFSGSDELAAVDGDFIMTAKEVQPVLRALRKAGIHIVALHNHMIGEKPAFFFTHFWAKGSAQDLANGLKSALDVQSGIAARAGEHWRGLHCSFTRESSLDGAALRGVADRRICSATMADARGKSVMMISIMSKPMSCRIAGLAALAASLLINPGLKAEERSPLERVATIKLQGVAGTLDHLSADFDHSRLFVANESNNTLDVVDVKSNKLVKQVAGQKEIHGIAYARDLDRIFVGNGEGVCNALDGRDYSLLKSIPVPDADSVRYDPRTHRVFVAGENSLTVIDARSLEPLGTVKLPAPPHGFQIAAKRRRVYVNTGVPCEVSVVDPVKKEVVARYPLGSHQGIGPLTLDEAYNRILVGLRKQPRPAVLDLESGKECASLPIPEGSDDMSLDGKTGRIYISCSSGFVAVIRQVDADHYELVANVPTIKGAKTSLYDATRKRLYVVVPRQPQAEGPEVWVYQARP